MSKAIRKQILRAEREHARAFNRGDVRGAMLMFHKDFVGFSSTRHARIHGLSALKKTFLYYLKRAPKMFYHIEQPHVHASGSTAVATFYWTVAWARAAVSAAGARTSSCAPGGTGALSTSTFPAPADRGPTRWHRAHEDSREHGLKLDSQRFLTGSCGSTSVSWQSGSPAFRKRRAPGCG